MQRRNGFLLAHRRSLGYVGRARPYLPADDAFRWVRQQCPDIHNVHLCARLTRKDIDGSLSVNEIGDHQACQLLRERADALLNDSVITAHDDHRLAFD
ncbi:hypothetical protein D3C75_700910 [compost metagenome]